MLFEYFNYTYRTIDFKPIVKHILPLIYIIIMVWFSSGFNGVLFNTQTEILFVELFFVQILGLTFLILFVFVKSNLFKGLFLTIFFTINFSIYLIFYSL